MHPPSAISEKHTPSIRTTPVQNIGAKSRKKLQNIGAKNRKSSDIPHFFCGNRQKNRGSFLPPIGMLKCMLFRPPNINTNNKAFKELSEMREAYIAEQSRISKARKMDKQMDKIRAEFQKNHVIMKKQKASVAKTKSTGRFVSALPAEGWLTAVATFLIYALPRDSGKAKKTLRKMLETMEINGDVEPLVENLMESRYFYFEPTMDAEELALVWEDLMMEAEHLDDAEVEPSRLNLRILNEEVKKIQKKTLSVKEQKKLRFYTFLKKFEEKLLTLKISGDAEVWRFLDIMTSKIANISIKNREEKENGKQKEQPSRRKINHVAA
jgi:hypothetical protein